MYTEEEFKADGEAIFKLLTVEHDVVFTHGDLHFHNVIVKDGHISGIIDWECAGWYPEYWDYTRALFLRANYRPWCNIFTRIFPHYDTELTVEDAFWMVSDPY